MNLFVRSQYQLRTDILTMLDDTSNARWTDVQVYTAINQALAMWGGRVLIPHLYQPTGYKWNNGTYDYTLPVWMDEQYIQPQVRRVVPYINYPQLADGTETWVDVPGWSIEPTTSNGRKLRFETAPYNQDARILYWSQPNQIPTTVPTLSATISNGTATTFTLTGANYTVPFFGWYKIEDEVLTAEYSSRTATTVFANATRGEFNTYATSHTPTTPVYFCIAATDERLFVQLHDQAMAILHRMRFGLAAPEERQVHSQMIQLYQSQADRFWRSWTPQRPIRSRLTRLGLL